MSTSRLDGRIALVTGGSRGIGHAAARALASLGATVVVSGRDDSEALRSRVPELEALGAPAAVSIAADSADRNAIKNLYAEVLQRFKRLDILIHAAGSLGDGLLGMISDDVIDRTIDVNLKGTLRHLQGATRLMQRSGSGAIVLVTSIMGTRGAPGVAAYAAAKAGIVGLVRSASKELAPKKIRVNAVSPGFIDTDMTAELSPEVRSQRISQIGLGRAGTADEVAGAIVFLATDASTYITGQILGVDGGMVL